MPNPSSVHESESIVLRHCASAADYAAVYALQEETWGSSASVLVSTPILKVAPRVGGITAGAFDAQGRLLGFVFGLTGPQGGRLIHWSDMLAVRPEARDLRLGRRLKAFQREACRAIGVEAMQWTYDPLVARNAHLNLSALGAHVVEYVTNMYSDSDSPLHAGLGTDRLVVEWPIDAARESRQSADANNGRDALLLTDGETLTLAPLSRRAPAVRIPVPADIHAVLANDPARAQRWRECTREAFVAAHAAGYTVNFFARAINDHALSAYVLTPAHTSPAFSPP
jgi:predicted GNAT superfamily acetyltransferase